MPSKSKKNRSVPPCVPSAEQRAAEPAKQADWGADGFATVREAAAFLRLSLPFVYKLIANGQLPAARFGRACRIPWKGLRSFAEQAASVR